MMTREKEDAIHEALEEIVAQECSGLVEDLLWILSGETGIDNQQQYASLARQILGDFLTQDSRKEAAELFSAAISNLKRFVPGEETDKAILAIRLGAEKLGVSLP